MMRSWKSDRSSLIGLLVVVVGLLVVLAGLLVVLAGLLVVGAGLLVVTTGAAVVASSTVTRGNRLAGGGRRVVGAGVGRSGTGSLCWGVLSREEMCWLAVSVKICSSWFTCEGLRPPAPTEAGGEAPEDPLQSVAVAWCEAATPHVCTHASADGKLLRPALQPPKRKQSQVPVSVL